MKKILIAFLLFIFSLIPINKIKFFLFKFLPGITFVNSRIGYFNLIYTDKLSINNTTIGHFNFFQCKEIIVNSSKINNFNFFYNFKKILILKKSIIGSFNFFFSKFKNRSIFFLVKSQISSQSFFDLNGSLILRNNVVFGGHNSMILSVNNQYEKTFFNRNIFIGSKTLFTSGVKIKCEESVIGSCSVVSKNLIENGSYYSKKLIKI